VPLISLKGIRKDYVLGSTVVPGLRGVDLEIEPREFSAVIGPSGSGKTTLLNIIGCLDRPSGGAYLFDGESVGERDFDDLATLRNRSIGFIFQSFNLIPVLDVYENIEFPCLITGRRTRASRERVRRLADEVGLTAYLRHRPDELSGGQRQRVAIARALVTEPRIVLADEPTANLDSVTSGQIIDLMLELNREQGVTFLFSTHDTRVTQHARRIVQLADGVVVGERRLGQVEARLGSDSVAPLGHASKS
jgi:putative ABC transport system ATP-binding protein